MASSHGRFGATRESIVLVGRAGFEPANLVAHALDPESAMRLTQLTACVGSLIAQCVAPGPVVPSPPSSDGWHEEDDPPEVARPNHDDDECGDGCQRHRRARHPLG